MRLAWYHNPKGIVNRVVEMTPMMATANSDARCALVVMYHLSVAKLKVNSSTCDHFASVNSIDLTRFIELQNKNYGVYI
jgi:hypothetical protein